MGNVVAGCYIVCRKGETIINGNGDITLNGYAIIPLEQYSGVMPNDAVPPVTYEQWMRWQKLVSDEHGMQEAEINRLRAALAYYAAPDHWEYGEVPGHVYAHDDAGGFARKALGMPQRIPAGERLEIELECRRIMDEEFRDVV